MDKKQVVITKRIKVFGMIQGVGFRPLVFRLAEKYKIHGTVKNIGGIVEIIAQAFEEHVNSFLYDLESNSGNEYEIDHIQIEDIKEKPYTEFKIIKSSSDQEVSIIPPDLPVCKKCQKEMDAIENRRYQNPFISCTACGPRYTIIEKLPYDRGHTSMEDFVMCQTCNKEYTETDSRRFHAQTISCNDCGPYAIMNDRKDKEAISEAVNILKSGGILAVKGIGGYHFVCSPLIEETVLNLRKLKGREEKPFAVMFENIKSIEEYCIVSKEERDLLESKARPIVLLYTREKGMAEATGKGGIYCGAFLPYTPLQILLTRNIGPLIMTSANLSDKPIIKEDNIILNLKSPYLNGVLYHKRRIVRSVDDSVAKVIDHKPQLLRRSRGYVPYPIFLPQGDKENTDLEIFAAGSDLKAAFCLYKKGSGVVSQYFGDLEERSVLEEYKSSFVDLSTLLQITPGLALCDLHPNYHSSRYAKSLGIPVILVQHHHAHIASVMAEYDLEGPVIGVAFDGTGYGSDGNIWGGEFLICEKSEFSRAAHLQYTPMLGGDTSMSDAKKTADCFLLKAGLITEIQDDRLPVIKGAIENHINTVLTSSMGRLFDAVSSILSICHKSRYEGECAAMLEKEAVLALRKEISPEKVTFAFNENNGIIEIDPNPVLKTLCQLRNSVDRGSLALGFHYGVADIILKVCEWIRNKQNINTVALGGGVFQNTVLSERVLKLLREKNFSVYVNMAVPPNDGSISLGQTYIGLMKSFNSKNSESRDNLMVK
ncbi:carbamoyltransferase HypF [Anaerocolumna sp. MB42-C2]|uniref:carbamoyltransferase HypF n=1 Tax=Anaerocolumna sp. MB42-C2 TaxID=3070997 RepID=UPI0027DF41C5|nr:carbamoyltransferase HypF [Anaerocolumna sp. MB42-C2]WMJ86103.1 carbamoyltransferase HypF [Anaerocolumna sp. MB42-C2]